jgi:eukaryotic-like serine/threonine-protein kinase
MGSVYQAEHRLMNRPVALKVIDRHLVQTPGLVERFHREVRAAAKLAHPNIVTAYDAEQAGDLHFLVMELVQGEDLAETVRRRGPLPVEEACDYIKQTAKGLEHAHECGMVHRDIKPQNLMLTPAGQVKILDFGLAQFATEISETSGLTRVGSIMGTPDYMAPEQARDAHSADIRADIYSLGCTLHCLLSGRAPFHAGTAVEKIISHVQSELPPLAGLRDDIPSELAAVLRKMTAKSPADRYQTPAEVVEALSRIGFQPVRQEKPKPTRTGWKPRLPIAAAFAFLVLLAGVITVVTDKGQVEIVSEVGDVDVLVNGQEIKVVDSQSGSTVKWFPSGKYDVELKGAQNDIEIRNDGFTLMRWGKQIVTLKRKAAVAVRTGGESGETGVDLLALIDPKRDTISGDWRLMEKSLVCLGEAPTPQQHHWGIHLPGALPDEYDLLVKVERIAGEEGIDVGLVVGRQQVMARVDGWASSGYRNGLYGVADAKRGPGSSWVMGQSLKHGQKVEILSQVRRVGNEHSLRVVCGDREIINWQGTAAELSLDQWTSPPRREVLFLYSFLKEVRFSELRLIPKSSAQGKWKGWPKDAPPPAIAPLPRPNRKKFPTTPQ